MWRKVDILQIKDISSIQRNQLSLQAEPNYLSNSNFVVFNLLPQSHLMDFDKTLHRWSNVHCPWEFFFFSDICWYRASIIAQLK